MTIKNFAIVSAVLTLSACGGGGSGGANNFQSLGDQGIALINKYQTANYTPAQNMPAGSFSYSGVAGYSAISSTNPNTILNSAIALSSINLNADFENNNITGSLSNFVDNENFTGSGTVPLNGAISGNGFSAAGSGVIVSSFDNSNNFTSANITQGVFIGPEAQAAEGIMDVTYGNISGSGYFLAER